MIGVKTYTVTTPVPDYTGVVAGVALVRGSYHGPLTPAALAYFQGAGYLVVEDPAEPDLEAEPVEPGPVPVFEPLLGSPTRGASKTDWVTFATKDAPEGLRLTEEQAQAINRDQLAEKFLGKKED